MKRFLILAVMVLMLVPMVAQGACTQAISNQAKQQWLEGMYAPGDTYKFALYTTAGATLNKSTTAYTASGEITGTNYAAGGATASGYVVGLYTDTATLDFSNVAWTSTTQTADCALLYDATAHHASCTASHAPYYCCTGSGAGADCDNAAIAVFTFSSTSSTSGTWTLVMPTPAAATSLIRIALNDFLPQWLAWSGDMGRSEFVTPEQDEIIAIAGR